LDRDITKAEQAEQKEKQAAQVDTQKQKDKARQQCKVAMRKAQTWLDDDDHEDDARGGGRAKRALENVSCPSR